MSPHSPINRPPIPALCLSQRALQRQKAAPCDPDRHFCKGLDMLVGATLQNYAAKSVKEFPDFSCFA